jgi:hypothetical protein
MSKTDTTTLRLWFVEKDGRICSAGFSTRVEAEKCLTILTRLEYDVAQYELKRIS